MSGNANSVELGGQHASWIKGEEKNKTYWHVRPVERDDKTDGQEAMWRESAKATGEENDGETFHDAKDNIIFTTDEDGDEGMDTVKADEVAYDDDDDAADKYFEENDDEDDSDDSNDSNDDDAEDLMECSERIPCIVTQVPRGKDGLAW